VDLVFREDDCLVFVEVKARSAEDWTRPAAAVDAPQTPAAFAGCAGLPAASEQPQVKIRFEHRGGVAVGRARARGATPANAFGLSPPYRYG